jgi:hypothetical protein
MIWKDVMINWIVWFCDGLRLWGFHLLLSYRSSDSCYRIPMNLTVFVKHWCDTSRRTPENLPDEYQQILHMGKSGSLTCHLLFPDSLVLHSIKWYKVRNILQLNFFLLKYISYSWIFSGRCGKEICLHKLDWLVLATGNITLQIICYFKSSRYYDFVIFYHLYPPYPLIIFIFMLSLTIFFPLTLVWMAPICKWFNN